MPDRRRVRLPADANHALGLPVDSREYGIDAQILRDLEVSSIRLMTNNPVKYGGLASYGITITERIPITTPPDQYNAEYLSAKARRLDHLLDADMSRTEGSAS